jgi:DNA polymerase III subunit delta
MVTVLTGENSFMLQQELRRIVGDFVADHSDMGLEQLDGEEAEFDRLRESLQSLPFLASKKLVVLRTPSANKQFVEAAQDLLTELPETTDVIIVEPKLDKRQSYYKFLKKQPGFHEFSQMDVPALAKWLVDQAAFQGGTLGRQDATYLVERVGANQQLLSNELAKLLQYDPHITRNSIDELTERAPQSTIFELLDAALAGKRKRALELYQEQRTMKVEPQQILALLGWQLHVMALVKTAGERDPSQIASEAKINPFVVHKTQGIVRNMTLSELKALIHEVFILDIRLKSESIDADEALQNLILMLGK